MKKIDYKKLQQETLAYFEKMKGWVRRENPKRRPEGCEMFNEIGVDWEKSSCPYCRKFLTEDGCNRCPLETVRGCCNGFWQKMDDSKTWMEWFYWADKVEKFIERHGIPENDYEELLGEVEELRNKVKELNEQIEKLRKEA